jgi:hypothetical protein
MAKNAQLRKHLLATAGAIAGGGGTLAIDALIWRSSPHLNEWGDENMGNACAIHLGAVLLGAFVGGMLGHRLARWRRTRSLGGPLPSDPRPD